MAPDPTIIHIPDAIRSGKHNQKKKKQLKHRNAETPRKPEWRYQLLICTLVFMEKLSTRLGQIASIWATTILLGGFLSGLSRYDFWVIAALALASSLRIFGIDYEQKLNPKSESRRRILFKWLYSVVVKGTPKFHIAGSTVVAGILDSSMYVLQLASAVVSLVFSILRLWQDNFVPPSGDSGNRNQREAIILYYSMVLVENVLFIPAKLGWELPRPLDKTIVFSISYDNETLFRIFEILDKYFVQVLAAARKSTAEGLSMSLRRYISDLLFEGQVDNAAAILTLDVLYQQDEWIKRKFDADKRVKLLPIVLNYIKETNDHQSREAAISLLTRLVVNKTDTPEPSKFGPLVLFRALDIHEFVELMTKVRSISQPVLKYLESCMDSSSQEEVYLAIRALRKMPVAADLVQNTRIPELLRNRAVSSEKPAGLKSPVSIAALILVTLKELGLQLPDQLAVSAIVDELVNRSLKVRELEILLGLEKHGLLTPEQRDKVPISNLFYKTNFMRCLPEIVEWFSSLENDALVAQLKKLPHRNKEWLVGFLQQSRGRYRPDITTLCSLLVKDKYFLNKFEEIHVLRELLNDR